jgi:hypothetical protein
MGNLTATEKQIAGAAAAVVLLSIYAVARDWGFLVVVPMLSALAALAILFLPQISPNTKAPGSKGSLLMVSGVLAAVFWLISALTWLDWIFSHLGSFDTWLYLIGFAASLYFGWLCWRAFQAEGGKFQFGSTDITDSTAAPPPAEPASAPPAAAPPSAAPAAPPPAAPASPPADTGMGVPPPSSTEGDEENRV